MDKGINEKNWKQIKLILIAGLVLLVADLIATFASPGITVIEQNGELYMVRPEMGAPSVHDTFKVKLHGKSGVITKKIDVSLESISDENQAIATDLGDDTMSEAQRDEYELRSVTGAFNKYRSERLVPLPSRLTTGASVGWHRQRTSNAPYISLLTMMLIASVYGNRYSQDRKQKRLKQESVLAQLPSFVNRLVLLLNAGLVLNTAFEKSIEETISFNKNEQDYLALNLGRILTVSRNANGSIPVEFRNFAKSSGIKELMRISSIISDNYSKGVELTEKLETEEQILWLNRKKLCEERGRLAETKLTLPLVIFLMVLIVITVAPALLEI